MTDNSFQDPNNDSGWYQDSEGTWYVSQEIFENQIENARNLSIATAITVPVSLCASFALAASNRPVLGAGMLLMSLLSAWVSYKTHNEHQSKSARLRELQLTGRDPLQP